jgi:Ca2+/Na+ antiporter
MAMTTEGVETDSTGQQALSPRLQEFQSEVNQLKVTGGRANPERTWTILGALAMIVGLVLTLIAWLATRNTSDTLEIADYSAMGSFGLALTVAGTGLFLVMSLRRYFRYWLVRLIYEQRDQTDRIVGGR